MQPQGATNGGYKGATRWSARYFLCRAQWPPVGARDFRGAYPLNQAHPKGHRLSLG